MTLLSGFFFCVWFRMAVTCRFSVWSSRMKDFISAWQRTLPAARRPWLNCCSESQVGNQDDSCCVFTSLHHEVTSHSRLETISSSILSKSFWFTGFFPTTVRQPAHTFLCLLIYLSIYLGSKNLLSPSYKKDERIAGLNMFYFVFINKRPVQTISHISRNVKTSVRAVKSSCRKSLQINVFKSVTSYLEVNISP